MSITNEQAKNIYLHMRRIRDFEQAASDLFAQIKIPGFGHLYTGEEAIASAVCECLNQDDYITSTHRGHGHIIAKGGDLNRMMAELFGRETGYCKGKGGSMHIADDHYGILGANGIVGAGLSISVGAGLSAKYLANNKVCVCFFGDGASNQGTFHEAINMASNWKLPIIYVCENNLYGISTRQDKHMNIKNISDRAVSYGIPGVSVDGNDVEAVFNATTEAVKRARAGEGPTLIECKTYRHFGHFNGDPAIYRTKEEVDEWLKKDPIPRFRTYAVEKGIMTQEELDAIDKQVADEIVEAIAYAEVQPYAPVESTVQDVYTDIVEEVRDR